MSATTWPTWRYFARLIAFRPWLWGPNLLSIVLLIGLETVPGLVSRAFFDWLNGGMGELQPFMWMVVLLMLSTLGRVTFLFGCQFTNAPFMYTGTALLQHNMFRRLLELPAAVALQHTAGEALSRFRDDTEETGIFLIPFNDVIAWSLFAVVGLAILISVSVTLTVGVFVPLVVLSFVLHALRVRIESYRRAVRAATADVTSHLGDAFGAAQTIQLANAERGVVERFRTLNRVRLDTAIRDRLLDQLLQSISRNTSNIGTGVILLLASRSMVAGSFSVGDFALFVFYMGWVGEFTALFGSTLAKYRQAGVSFGRMVELMQGSAPPRLVEHRPIFRSPTGSDTVRSHQPFERLEVVDLTYLHPGSGRGVRHIIFHVKRGERVMITGRVASGKTTLLRALLGVLPRDSGSVLWNGRLVEDPADFLVPPRCGYTPQVPRLFSETLRRNLLLGLDADAAEVDLDRAVAVSQFSADLAALQAGLDSEVGARGVALSGGQMQRAALARMLVRPAELLVLDDLSSLDGPTDPRHDIGVFALISGAWGRRLASHRSGAPDSRCSTLRKMHVGAQHAVKRDVVHNHALAAKLFVRSARQVTGYVAPSARPSQGHPPSASRNRAAGLLQRCAPALGIAQVQLDGARIIAWCVQACSSPPFGQRAETFAA